MESKRVLEDTKYEPPVELTPGLHLVRVTRTVSRRLTFADYLVYASILFSVVGLVAGLVALWIWTLK